MGIALNVPEEHEAQLQPLGAVYSEVTRPIPAGSVPWEIAARDDESVFPKWVLILIPQFSQINGILGHK